jgi:DNA-directed RNA polymerase subunit alpha
LNLEIWTDRTIEPGEAMIRSASILISMLNAFVNYGTTVQVEAEKEYAELAMSEEQYNMPVEQLALSVRTMNCLRRGNISTVGELISRGEKGLLALRNFGQKSRLEIEERLNEIGLSLTPVQEEIEEPADEDSEDMMGVAAEAASVGAEDAGEQDGSPKEEQ